VTPRAPIPAILLPGMDGSGRLYAPLLAAGPRGIAPRLVSFPTDAPLRYDELLPLARAALPKRGRYVLLAESFSGPVAVRLAAERPRGLAAVVLAATFLHRPLNPILHPLRALVGARFFGAPMPAPVIRHFLAGPDASDAVVEEVRAAMTAVEPEVMAVRATEALAVDVREDLEKVEAPLLFLVPTRDRLIRTDVAEEVLQLRPDAEVALLDSPHMILQRCPHASLARIEEFLAQPGARRGAVA
jgi:pimeloyl-[acyl-carrier protein] methyl ester esterase